MINAQEINFFGETNFRHKNVRFGIKLDDRRRHMYVVGKTGMGKSTLLENMIINDIQSGNGVTVTDPHGDLVEKILDYIPANRINDVVYFNPHDSEYPIAFNVLENPKPEYKNLIASGLVGVFKKIWADSWGPRLEYILMNSILALLENPGNTLLSLPRLLVDKKFRKKIVENVRDPVVKSFWVDEYANYNERFRNEAIAPIQNKIGQFLSSALIRNILAQPKSSLDIRKIMDSRKIILMNLAKGRIGEENSALLGAMMITRIQLAAMSRVDVPEEERKDFYLYVDEFQNFATESFANILSEARKYRLNLIVAHQYMEQLGDVVKAAVLGNVGTLIVFRVGAADAEEFEKEFEPYFMQIDIVNLPKFQMYLKLMIDGIASDPFNARSLPPMPKQAVSYKDTIIRVSREQYANPRKDVEEHILRWAGFEEGLPELDETEKIKPAKIRPSDVLELSGIPANARKVTPEVREIPRGQTIMQESQTTRTQPQQSMDQTPVRGVAEQRHVPIQERSGGASPVLERAKERVQEASVQQVQIHKTAVISRTTEARDMSQPEPKREQARAEVTQRPLETQISSRQESTPPLQEEKKQVSEGNDESVRLEKIETAVHTGPEVPLKQALKLPVMGFNGRPRLRKFQDQRRRHTSHVPIGQQRSRRP